MEYQLAILASWASWLFAVGAYETTKAAGKRVGEEVGEVISNAIRRTFNINPPPNVTDPNSLRDLVATNVQGTNHAMLEKVERETVTVLTKMLSDVTRLQIQDIKTIYINVGMFAQIGIAFEDYFGPRDTRPDIASKIVLWARARGKLNELIDLTRAQNEERA